MGAFIAYMCIHGNQLIYALYIPLDIFLSLARTSFYWYNYYLDKKSKEDDERLKARLLRRQQSNQERLLS